MSDELLELTAAEAIERDRRPASSAADEYFDAYAEAAAGDELSAYLWRAEARRARTAPRRRALQRRPDRRQGHLLHGGRSQTTAGSRILEGYRPPYTATAVAQAGRRPARRCSARPTWTSSRWAPRTRTPATGRSATPGTSSASRAAPRAARRRRSPGGLAPWAIGTDTGGSIRQPAALCGIVGLKPTYGAISRYGMVAFASSLDQCGPLTRDVTDAALLLRRAWRAATAATRPRVGIEGGVELPSARATSTGLALRRAARALARGRGNRAGRGARSSSATLALIEELGGEVEEIELPHAAHGISAYYVIAPAEASANLARYDGVRYGLRARRATATSIEMYERTRAAGFGAEVKRRIMLGTYALSSGYYDAYYGRAQRVRTKIAEDFATAFERCRLRRDARPRRRSPSSSAREPPTRWRCTCPTTSRCRCRWPAFRRSRSRPGSPSPTAAARAAGRAADRRAGVRRVGPAGRGARARGGDRLRRQARGGRR